MARPLAIKRWLFFLGISVSLLIQSGDLGSADAGLRLQVTRALWTDAPEVRPSMLHSSAIRSEDGTYHVWYGIGQSVLMLPGDIVAVAIIKSFGLKSEIAKKIRGGIVSVLTFTWLTGLSLVLAYKLLVVSGFSESVSALASMLGHTRLRISTPL